MTEFTATDTLAELADEAAIHPPTALVDDTEVVVLAPSGNDRVEVYSIGAVSLNAFLRAFSLPEYDPYA